MCIVAVMAPACHGFGGGALQGVWQPAVSTVQAKIKLKIARAPSADFQRGTKLLESFAMCSSLATGRCHYHIKQ